MWPNDVQVKEDHIPEGIERLECSITDVQGSYQYLGIPRANSKHEETTRRAATVKYLTGGAADSE